MLAVFILISLAAGALGSIFTANSVRTWYAMLQKPVFAPPNWLFAPVWTVLYILMGTAAYLVWEKGWKKMQVRIAVKVFIIQLVLNALWSLLFFGLNMPLLAFAEIIVLWIAILATIILFKKVSKAAAWLMLPYILWVSFAAVLNFALWLINFA